MKVWNYWVLFIPDLSLFIWFISHGLFDLFTSVYMVIPNSDMVYY